MQCSNEMSKIRNSNKAVAMYRDTIRPFVARYMTHYLQNLNTLFEVVWAFMFNYLLGFLSVATVTQKTFGWKSFCDSQNLKDDNHQQCFVPSQILCLGF